MKILGISASPRVGGNTEFIVNEVLKSAKEEGAEVELLTMVNKEIKPCMACESCYENAECAIQDDDAAFFFDKMMEADGIVIGSPVYFGSVTSPLKSLIDREQVLWNQERSFKGKICASVAVGWKWGHNTTLSAIDGFFLTNKGMVISNGGVPGFGLMVYAEGKGEAEKNEDAIKEAIELGKLMVETINKVKE
ncbi:MAG: flavodoxin family protein [Candidatus Methanofastidiosa archaeon]|nr:flavodoxin family protein [Candidatus Methanofastidiosa archaeon]